MASEYMKFASKKKYQEHTLAILEQFEVEEWIGQETRNVIQNSSKENSDGNIFLNVKKCVFYSFKNPLHGHTYLLMYYVLDVKF